MATWRLHTLWTFHFHSVYNSQVAFSPPLPSPPLPSPPLPSPLFYLAQVRLQMKAVLITSIIECLSGNMVALLWWYNFCKLSSSLPPPPTGLKLWHCSILATRKNKIVSHLLVRLRTKVVLIASIIECLLGNMVALFWRYNSQVGTRYSDNIA